jgi:hypothetical protein
MPSVLSAFLSVLHTEGVGWYLASGWLPASRVGPDLRVSGSLAPQLTITAPCEYDTSGQDQGRLTS